MGNYHEIRDELIKRLREAGAGARSNPERAETGRENHALDGNGEEFGDRATYVSADSTEAQMSGWWEQVVRAAGERARKAGGRTPAGG